jgi:ornithine carbamoyltransferase
VADTANSIITLFARMVIRCHEHSLLEDFAKSGTMPVVNALSNFLHPCQFMTDMFTLAERWSKGKPENYVSSLKGRKIAFLGDTACNMANSFILGGAALGVEIALAGPVGYEPTAESQSTT